MSQKTSLEETLIGGTKAGYFANLTTDDISNLEGKLLTLMDAVIQERSQNKAVKDIIRRTIWYDWAQNLDLTEKDIPVGMPDRDIV